MQTPPSLNDRIRHFYDRSTGIWLDTWGEHMHHGYYGPDGAMQQDHVQAQIDLIAELLRWGKVEKAAHILDAGCGVGGSARLLAKALDAKVLGLTLSPVQAEQAARLNRIAGLAGQVRVEVQDVLQPDAARGPFDLVWSLESAEHIPGKQRLLQVFFDALRPGGKLLMATWCHRDTPPDLDTKEQNLLQKIGKFYHLPPLISLGEYEQIAHKTGFRAVKTADWTAAVSPFWPAVIRSALRWRSIAALLRAGGPALQGAWAMQYMLKGYRTGALRFGLLQAQKP
ncbi:MAG TPA: class I SAM-dependent methyltransferase [Saprospiraceae bacterium]|nr:class I SAM-dependent methyltransferase [Saprospiraceae bacterium]